MKLKTYGSIEDGKLNLYQRSELSKALSTWKDCGIELTIRSTTKGRSSQQNRYYWTLLGIVKDLLYQEHQVYYNLDDLHIFFKGKFNAIEIITPDGVVERLPVTTTDLTTVEFIEYVENIKRWTADVLCVALPGPDEQLKLL